MSNNQIKALCRSIEASAWLICGIYLESKGELLWGIFMIACYFINGIMVANLLNEDKK